MKKVSHDTAPVLRRIAMVAACPFPSLRGSQVLIRELAQSLADRGHTVHVVTYPHGESLAALHGIHVHRVRAPWGAAHKAHSGWRRLLLDMRLAGTLYGVVRRARIEVIHAHNYEAPLAGFLVRWLTGVPIVYHAHNALGDELAYYVAPGWRRGIAACVGRLLDRQVPRRADFSIALTPELEDYLRSCGVTKVATIAPPSAPVQLPADANPLPADPNDHRPEFEKRFVVMYAGNLDPYQDLDVLWAAVATLVTRVPHILLRVVTHETNWQRRAAAGLLQLCETGVAQVIVAPTFSSVRRFMASADVLVCPRRSWSGFPIKLMNYLASGRPVVVAQGSAKGVIDGETGLVFRNGDADDLAATLSRLAHDPLLRERLGEQARAMATAAGTQQRHLDQIEEVYAQVCGPPASLPAALAVKETWLRGLIAFSKDRISAASGGATRY